MAAVAPRLDGPASSDGGGDASLPQIRCPSGRIWCSRGWIYGLGASTALMGAASALVHGAAACGLPQRWRGLRVLPPAPLLSAFTRRDGGALQR
nr:unnamed protein product [Digitaria exilis]